MKVRIILSKGTEYFSHGFNIWICIIKFNGSVMYASWLSMCVFWEPLLDNNVRFLICVMLCYVLCPHCVHLVCIYIYIITKPWPNYCSAMQQVGSCLLKMHQLVRFLQSLKTWKAWGSNWLLKSVGCWKLVEEYWCRALHPHPVRRY